MTPAKPHWVLEPAAPQPGDPGPLTIRDVDDTPIHWTACVIPGSLGHQKPEGDLGQLLHRDDIAAARLIVAAPALRHVLQALVQWARYTGEWEAPCWRKAERVLTEAGGLPPPPGKP